MSRNSSEIGRHSLFIFNAISVLATFVGSVRPTVIGCSSSACDQGQAFSLVSEAVRSGSGPLRTPKQLRHTLAVASKWLRDADIPFTVIYGTALQLYRDGGLMKHDDDVDILIRPEDMDRVEEVLVEQGYYNSHFEGYPMQQLGGIPNGSPLDIYVDMGGSDTVCVQHDAVAWPRDYVDSDDWPAMRKTFEMDGQTFSVKLPAQPEKFFAMTYGDGWKIPQDNKGDTTQARELFDRKCTKFIRPLPPSHYHVVIRHITDTIKMTVAGYRRNIVANLTLYGLHWEEKALIGVSLSAIVFAILVQWRNGWAQGLGACCVAPYIALSVLDYLMVRLVTKNHGGAVPFNTVCAVIVIEFSKLVASLLLVLLTGGQAAFAETTMRDVRHLAIPASFYFLNNSLHYHVLSRVRIADFAIVYEMQIVFVAILWMVVFHRQLSPWRAVACMGVMTGVMIHRGVPGISSSFTLSSGLMWPFLNATVTATACVSNEYVFKNNTKLDLNVQNVCLYSFGIGGGLLLILAFDPQLIGYKFFEGLNFMDVGFLLTIRIVMGLVVSRILKYVDSISKTVASSISGPLALGFAPRFLGEQIQGYTVLAAAVTYLSSFIYWLDPSLVFSTPKSTETLKNLNEKT